MNVNRTILVIVNDAPYGSVGRSGARPLPFVDSRYRVRERNGGIVKMSTGDANTILPEGCRLD